MAIPAVRFKPFDEETNLAIADFADIQTNDIFNSPNSQLQEVSDALQALLDKGKPLQDEVTALTDELTRATADAFGAVKDITGMIPKDIEKSIASMLPDNSIVQNMFKQLSTECKKKGLGNGHNMRPFKNKSGCNSGSGACDKAQIGGILGKVTGGIGDMLGGIANTLNQSFNAILALANLGYDVGFCKVFQALANALGGGNNSLLSKAGAALLGQMGNKGNTSAIIDIAGQMSGLSPLIEFPGAISYAVETYNVKGVDLPSLDSQLNFSDRFEAGMEIMQDNWMKSSTGLDSIANMGGRVSDAWADVLETKASKGWVDDDNLEDTSSNSYAPLSGAYNSIPDFTEELAFA